MNENIKMCIDMVLPEEKRKEARELAIKENPDNAEINGNNNGNELALVVGKKWANGRILRVRFLDGDINIQRKVEEYAHTWEEFANIKFVFGNDPNAEIRISFRYSGSWSYIGTDCLAIAQDQATMNYGWFNVNTPDQEYSRTVIHEFGHALGMIHGHQAPNADIPWDKEKVYEYFARTNGWDRGMVDNNIFRRYSANETIFSDFDKDSIMIYAIPNELTIGNYEIGWNTKLSNIDKESISKMYPMSNSVNRELVGAGIPAADK